MRTQPVHLFDNLGAEMSDDYGYFGGDDIVLGGDPDTNNIDLDRETKAELAEIERLSKLAFSQRSDGLPRDADPALTQLGAVDSRTGKRIHNGYGNVGRGRPRKTPMANAGRTGRTASGRDEAGAGGVGPAHHSLSESVEPVTGGVSGQQGSGDADKPPVAYRSRAIRVLPPDAGRLGVVSQIFKKPEFERASFAAALKDFKFTAQGDVDIRFIIPYEFRAEAVKFADAFGLDIEFTAVRKKYDAG